MINVPVLYVVGDAVFQLTTDKGVLPAIVKSVNVSVTATGTVVTYTIQYKVTTLGVVSNVPEVDLFPDVDAVLAAYRVKLLAI